MTLVTWNSASAMLVLRRWGTETDQLGFGGPEAQFFKIKGNLGHPPFLLVL